MNPSGMQCTVKPQVIKMLEIPEKRYVTRFKFQKTIKIFEHLLLLSKVLFQKFGLLHLFRNDGGNLIINDKTT